MKIKKLVAVATAIALMVLPLQVALADSVGNQAPITGDGTVDYVDPSSIIKLILPTSSKLNFTLDPQNLAATQGVGMWNPSSGGSIIPSAVCILGNESAVPIKATVHLTLNDPTLDPDNKVVLVDDSSEAAVNGGTAKNMYLSFVPAKSKTKVDKGAIGLLAAPTFVKDSGGAPVVFHGADLTAAGVDPMDMLDDQADPTSAGFGQFIETGAGTGDYNQVEVPAHGAIALSAETTVSQYTAMEDATSAAVLTDLDDGIDLSFVLDKADYYVLKAADGSYSLKLDEETRNNNYDTASFILSGLINRNADWSGYGIDKMTVTAAYTIAVITPDAYSTAMTKKLGSSYNSIAPTATISGVTVTPGTPSVVMGDTLTFSATVAGTNSPDQTVTWSLSGANKAGTTIDASTGLLTVAANETAASLTVKATSTVDNSMFGTATVTVTAPPATVTSVDVTPAAPSVVMGSTQAFSATVHGTNNPDPTVTWSLSGANKAGTTIDANSGLLTVAANETAASLTVTATANEDGTTTGTATVTVTAPVPVGFTDAGNAPTSTKTYTFSKAAPANLTMGFNFGGNTITQFLSYNGTAMSSPTDYTTTANSVTITAAKLGAAANGTRAYTFKVNGVTYTVNVTIS